MTAEPEPTVLRLGTPDAGELLTLQRAAYVSEAQLYGDPDLPPLRETLEQVRAVLADPGVTVLGVRENGVGRLVAGVRLRQLPDRLELGRLAVAPDLQGSGLGTRLLLAAPQHARPGTREIVLFTGDRSAANLRLYQRHGYVETHRSANGTHDLVHLARALP